MDELRSIYGEGTGGLLQRTGKSGATNMLDIQNLKRIRIALRRGTKVYPIPMANYAILHGEVDRRWNQTNWPEVAGCIFTDLFKGNPMSVHAAHMFEKGFFMGMMHDRMVRSKELELGAETEVLSADKMQALIEQYEAEARGDDVL